METSLGRRSDQGTPADKPVTTSAKLPFVLINVAASADGKIAPASRQFVPFGSARDRQHMLELRATADAVMSGARTVDLSPVNLGPGTAKYRRLRLDNGLQEYNLRVIVSGSGSIDPKAEIFKHRFSPIIVLTTARAPSAALKRLRSLADAVEVFGEKELNFAEALRWLRSKWNVKRLLCEGGGAVNGALFQAGLVDELHLTLCPLIFGGAEAPTVADGSGFSRLSDATRMRLISLKTHGDELFLVYRTKR